MSRTSVRGSEFGHSQRSNTGAQPEGFRVVQICQTARLDRRSYALESIGTKKIKRKGKENSMREGKERKIKDKSNEGTSETSNTKCTFCEGKDILKTMSHELSKLTMIDSDPSIAPCALLND